MKVVVNRCYGGFSISKKAAEFMAARGNIQAQKELEDSECRFSGYGYSAESSEEYDRTDKDLIAAVEELGEEANGKRASLEVVEIPDDVKYTISNYDGIETIEEKHKSW